MRSSGRRQNRQQEDSDNEERVPSSFPDSIAGRRSSRLFEREIGIRLDSTPTTRSTTRRNLPETPRSEDRRRRDLFREETADLCSSSPLPAGTKQLSAHLDSAQLDYHPDTALNQAKGTSLVKNIEIDLTEDSADDAAALRPHTLQTPSSDTESEEPSYIPQQSSSLRRRRNAAGLSPEPESLKTWTAAPSREKSVSVKPRSLATVKKQPQSDGTKTATSAKKQASSKSRANGRPQLIMVTVCFLLDEHGLLFHPPSYGAGWVEKAAENLLTRIASPPRGQQQIKDMDIIEDSFYIVELPADATTKDLKNHIRRLLNVHFNHFAPEYLDPTFQFYDEHAPHVGGKPFSFPAKPPRLDSFLAKKMPSSSRISGELFAIVDAIWTSRSRCCEAQSWMDMADPPRWVTCVLRRKQPLGRNQTFWEYAIRNKHKREDYDAFPTTVLSVDVEEDTERPIHGKYAVLYGVSLKPVEDS